MTVIEAQQALTDAGIECQEVGQTILCERRTPQIIFITATSATVTTSALATVTHGPFREFISNRWPYLVCGVLLTFRVIAGLG